MDSHQQTPQIPSPGSLSTVSSMDRLRDAKIDELFREASSLAADTGARIAVFAVKPDGEARQYGCPSVDSVVDRFLGGGGGGREAAAMGGAAMGGGATDRIVRRYVERKRREDASYWEGTAMEKELKDLQWQLEMLDGLRERLARQRDDGSSS